MISPAFHNRSQLFFLLGVFIITFSLPFVLPHFGIDKRMQFSQMPENSGAYTFIEKQIYEETKDIDLLFLSPSALWYAIDTEYTQAELSKKLGREATVISLGTVHRGEDLAYTLLREIIKRRRVHTVVFYPPKKSEVISKPHRLAYLWWNYEQNFDEYQALSPVERLSYFAMSVLGGPRHVLSLLRPNHRATPDKYQELHYTRLGSAVLRQTNDGGILPSVEVKPIEINPDDLIYRKDHPKFRFDGPPPNQLEKHFFTKIRDLLEANQIRLILCFIPDERTLGQTFVQARYNWPDLFDTDSSLKTAMVGIPPATLFQNFNEETVQDLVNFPFHYNAYGNFLYTRAITPALMKVYK